MIISSQGEACSPNDDIKALDLHGTEALRNSLQKIKASTAGGEAALLASAEIELEQEKQAEKTELAKIVEARQALQDFRDFLVQSIYKGAQALPIEEELLYSYNPETQEYEITRKDGQDIVLNLNGRNLQGELPLPPQLMVTRLICYNSQLTTLPELPASLTELICSGNQLTTLPELPASLTELICHSNQLTTLPELPNSLSQLDCYTNQLTTLPELPASLTNLNCGSNQLTTLPKLPLNLTRLDCYTNQLTTLPELPESLTNLDCSANQLETLPVLPASLTKLQCSSNQLTTLAELPNSLSVLDCGYNPSLSNDPATQNAVRAMRVRGGTVIAW